MRIRRGADPNTIDRLGYLAGNMGGVLDYEPPAFVDLMYTARAYYLPGQYGGTEVASSDVDGSPTAATRTIITTPAQNSGFTAGVYKGRFDSLVSVAGNALVNATVSNVVQSAGSTTFDVTVSGGAPQIILDFGGAAPGLQLIHPGYSTSSPPLLRTEAIDHYKQFACLRLMDSTSTNGNTETDWASRVSPVRKTGEKKQWELLIAMANAIYTATGSKLKSIWICIGHQTTSAYWASLAALIRDTLNPGIAVIVEYSNELWNFGFTQGPWVKNAALAEVAGYGGIGNLNFDGASNQYVLQTRLHARKTKEIAQIFLSSFGLSNPLGRVRPVYSGQFVNVAGWTTGGLSYLSSVYPAEPINSYLWGLSAAPYMQGTQQEMDAPANASEMLSVLRTTGTNSLATFSTPLAAWVSLSNSYGLQKPMAYECGPHTNFSSNRVVKYEAHIDSGMGLLIKDMFGLMWSSGWGMACYYAIRPGQMQATGENTLWSSCNSFGGAGDAKHQALLSMGPTALRAYTG